jgi:hypothetical protein
MGLSENKRKFDSVFVEDIEYYNHKSLIIVETIFFSAHNNQSFKLFDKYNS